MNTGQLSNILARYPGAEVIVAAPYDAIGEITNVEHFPDDNTVIITIR